MAFKNSPQALVLLAHGSRDAAWRAPFEAIAARISAQMALQQPGLQVRCAYLQLCAPDLAQVAADLCLAGCQHIAIAPLFLGAGTHMREDFPVLLAAVQAQLAGEGKRSLRAVLERLPVAYVDEAELLAADPGLHSFFDLDTPQDLAAASLLMRQ